MNDRCNDGKEGSLLIYGELNCRQSFLHMFKIGNVIQSLYMGIATLKLEIISLFFDYHVSYFPVQNNKTIKFISILLW